jgi:NADH:ubiquinone oxidoreductase subunit 6 (subunit J)
MNFAAALFYIFSGIAIVAALGTVLARNIVYAALSLVGAMVMIAGIFFILHADFLALVQLLIYAGAVGVLLIFGLMLTNTGQPATGPKDRWQRPMAFVAAVAFILVAGYAAVSTDWMQGVVPQLERVPPEVLANSLFRNWALPFEIASLVLLVAMIGAIVISRRETSND